jgi:hypothetical protein
MRAAVGVDGRATRTRAAVGGDGRATKTHAEIEAMIMEWRRAKARMLEWMCHAGIAASVIAVAVLCATQGWDW